MLLRTLAVTGALTWATHAAWAQAPLPADTEAKVSPSGGRQSAALEEIIVTAERRTETVQKSSLAIQVLGGEQLKDSGVKEVKDLGALVPGLKIGNSGSHPQFYIRGVGDFSSNAISNAAVATNLDGVYIARMTAVNGLFYDLERVEVVKGPQGTLYGQNATGGVINIITKRPELGEPTFSGNLEVGNYDAVAFDAAANLPIGDTLAVRLAGQLAEHDGYLSDDSNDANQKSARLRVLYEPSPSASLLFGADYTHFGDDGAAQVVRTPALPANATDFIGQTDPRSIDAFLAGAAATGLCAPAAFLGGLATAPAPAGNAPPRLDVCPPSPFGPQVLLMNAPAGDPSQDIDIYGFQAEANIDVGFATLTVIPSYRKVDIDETSFVGYRFHDIERSEETTFEARLSNESDRLKWVLGGYFFNEDSDSVLNVAGGLLLHSKTTFNLRNRSYAGFGQATASITPSLRFIAGLRYTSDSRKLLDGSSSTLYPSVQCGDPTSAECLEATYEASREFDRLNWKAGVEYDLSSENMLYLTASTGYKAGGLNQACGNSGYKPENLDAYEFGSRNRFLDNKLQINTEVFYWKYENQQVSHPSVDTCGNVVLVVENAGAARQYGATLDLVARPTASDTLRLGGEYLDSKYTDFAYAVPAAFAAVPGVTTGCSVLPGAPGTANVDCSGKSLISAPRWMANAAWDHHFDLANEATIVAHVDAQYSAARWLSLNFLSPQARGPSYVATNLSLTYNAADKWYVSAFVRNVTDEAIYNSAFSHAFVGTYYSASLNAPRTYGARIGFNF